MAVQQTFDFLGTARRTGEPLEQPADSLDLRQKLPKSRTTTTKTAVKQQALSPPATFSQFQKLSQTLTRSAQGPFPQSDPPVESTPLDVAGEPVADEQKAAESDRSAILKQLRNQVGCVSLANQSAAPMLSTGCAELDNLLPSGGLRIDALTEWVAESASSGAAALSLIVAARHLCPSHSSLAQNTAAGPLVVVDTQNNFYPPAAVALGIPVDRIFLVRPQKNADAVWAIDQALRCEAVAAVWATVGAWLDDRDARRFQLAAESGKTPGLFVRPASVRGRPSFADTRFYVSSVPQLQFAEQQATEVLSARVTIDRCRGGANGDEMLVGVDDQARLLSLTSVDPPSVLTNPLPQPVAPHSTPRSFPAARSTTTVHEKAVVHLAQQLAHPAAKQPKKDRRRA